MDNIIILKRPRGFLPKQKEVFDLCFEEHLGKDGKPLNNYVVYSGAFGAGKTMLEAHVGIKAAIDNPKSVGFVGSLTYPQMRDVVFRKFVNELDLYQKSLDDAGIPVKLVKSISCSPGKMNIVLNNESEIWFRSCDNERNLAGKDLDWFALDEPVDIDSKVFTQLIGRLRGEHIKVHFGLLATNPGSESHWIFKYFFQDTKDGYFAVETSTYDNYLIPNYEAYIKDMESRFDQDWVNRYLRGKWGAFAGQIYKNFIPEKHVKEVKYNSFTNIKQIMAGVDWGIRGECCILTILHTKENHIYVVEEYFEKDRSSHEVAHILSQLHKKYHYTKVYCDPSAADLIKQAFELGVPIGKMDKDNQIHSFANNDVAPGIAKIQSCLKNNILIVNRICINLIREFQSYRYQGDSDKPVKEDDHALDAIRYGLTDFELINDEIEFGCGHWLKRRRF